MDWFWWTRRLGRDHARTWGERTDGTPRRRVLLESSDGAEAHAVWRLLSRHGYDTMWCPGPSGRHVGECSLVRTGHCPLVDGADVIVNGLDQDDGNCAEVARQLERVAGARTSPTPVVVVVPTRRAAEFRASLPHCEVVPGPLRSKVLLHSVSRANPQAAEEVTVGRGSDLLDALSSKGSCN